MSTFFFCTTIALLLGFFIRHSHNELHRELARINRQLHAIGEGPSFVSVTRVGRKNANAIKLVKDATGLALPETAKLLQDTPCRIPFVFTVNQAEQLVGALQSIGVDASQESLKHVG